MAALLNPTARRLARDACRRISTPAAAEPLVSHRSTHERYSSSLVDVSGGFVEMLASTQKYYLLGGKGGVGRTSMAASLAMKFANSGEPTLIASMDPTHSLGDSLEQDMSDGKIIRIDGFDSLFAVEIGHVKLEAEPSAFGSWIHNILGRMGIEIPPDPVGTSKQYEMLNRVPPGLEEAFAISELMKPIELLGSDTFSRIVLDTASTGHTLKLLSAAKWIEKFLGLTIKAVNAASSMRALKSASGKAQVDSSMLEELRQQTARVSELLYDPQSTEFIVVTIPTMMAVSESSRFHASLKKDGAHTRRLVVNQVLPPSASDCRFCAAKLREQARAFSAIREDRELGGLKLIQAPLLDSEVKGVPALRFLSDSVWK
ncbi:ATPase GET3B-like [Phragmites australis]|uniref:ATPase GET3B-like n=1 Tax=Phragmites australis TaxID=29695 RepID=UPI002D798E4D|nr:ATPase GET3B-like [Phragmites australis]